MNQLCDDCRNGPRDMEGHVALELHVAPAGDGAPQKAAFKCKACGYEWMRSYLGSGIFAWSRFGS